MQHDYDEYLYNSYGIQVRKNQLVRVNINGKIVDGIVIKLTHHIWVKVGKSTYNFHPTDVILSTFPEEKAEIKK